MNVLDLFSGIGGFSLGLERAGMKAVAFCEIEPYCQRVLAKHWPGVPLYDDVRTLTAARLAADGIHAPSILADAKHNGRQQQGRGDVEGIARPSCGQGREQTVSIRCSGEGPGIDVICGGFPCQDISVAGKGAGIDGERSGLWSEYARIIGEVRPRYVIVENVAALLSRGLDRVLGDLAALGYDAEWHCISASAVGAPHIRDRLWIVAYPTGARCDASERSRQRNGGASSQAAQLAECCDVADATGAGLEERPIFGGYLAAELAAIERGGEAVPDADGARRAQSIGAGTPLHGRGPCQPAGQDGGRRNPWLVEPDVGGTLDGFSAWLDGLDMSEAHNHIVVYGNATKDRPAEILQALRREAGEAGHQRPVGGQGGVSPEAVLLAYLRKLSAWASDENGLSRSRSEALESQLRGVRPSEKSSRSSPGSGSQKQQSKQYPDSLPALSRLLAHHSQKGWARFSRENAAAVLNGWRPGWEDGFPRVAHGVPARVDRLRSLGNAVVPQIPELIGRAIMANGMR